MRSTPRPIATIAARLSNAEIFPIVATESAKIFVANAGSMEMRRLLELKADLEARKEPQVVLVHRPARQRSGLEPVGQLRIGLNGM